MYPQCRVAPRSVKIICRYIRAIMGYLRRVRISGEKGASQGRQVKGAILTAYVLYCFDARGVVVVQYCVKWGLLYSGGTVQTMHDQTA